MVVATTHYDVLKTYAATTEGWSRRFRLQPADVRADLSPELRIAGEQPRARDRDAARHAGVHHRAGGAHRSVPRSAAGRTPGPGRARQAGARSRAPPRRSERQTLEETASKLHARDQELRNREETFKRRLDERIEERLRDARREIDAVVETLKTKTEALASEAERRAGRLIPTGQTGAARADAAAAIDAIGEKLRTPAESLKRRRPQEAGVPRWGIA